MKAKVVIEAEFDSEDAFSKEDVNEGINDYFDIGNGYCDNIKIHPENITIKE